MSTQDDKPKAVEKTQPVADGSTPGASEKSLTELVAALDKTRREPPEAGRAGKPRPEQPKRPASDGRSAKSSAKSSDRGSGAGRKAQLEEALRQRNRHPEKPAKRVQPAQPVQPAMKKQPSPRAEASGGPAARRKTLPESEQAQEPESQQTSAPSLNKGPGLLARLKNNQSQSDVTRPDETTASARAEKRPAASANQPVTVPQAEKNQGAKKQAAKIQATSQQLVGAAQARVAKTAGQVSVQASRGLKKLERRIGQYTRLGSKALWRGLRKRTNPRAFIHDYRTILTLTHRYVFDRNIEQLFFVPTYGRVRLDRLTIDSPHRVGGHDYRATPRLLFDWAMDVLPDDLRTFSFYDIGAGRGRVLLLASRYNFAKVRGCEFAAELHDDAIMNIAQFPRSRMKCRDIDCFYQDALEMDIPETPLVLFFFDPISDAMLQRMMSRIVDSYRAAPRPIYLIFVDPPRRRIMRQLVEESNIFKKVPFGTVKSLLVRYFSPSRVRVYKSNS